MHERCTIAFSNLGCEIFDTVHYIAQWCFRIIELPRFDRILNNRVRVIISRYMRNDCKKNEDKLKGSNTNNKTRRAGLHKTQPSFRRLFEFLRQLDYLDA